MATPDAYTRTVKSGEVVFSAGEAGSDLFIIEDGRVELTLASPPVTYTLEVGDFFGERALVYDQRDATAKALTAGRLLKIDRGTFTAIVKVHPEIALLMLRSMPRSGGVAAAGAPAAAVPPPMPSSMPPLPGTPTTNGAFVHATNSRFPLARPDMLIGRSSAASGYTADIDLSGHDPDKTLSRKHARVTRSPEGVFLKEEEGRNGTFVNGTRIGAGQTIRLEDGDRVKFGLVEVVFRSA